MGKIDCSHGLRSAVGGLESFIKMFWDRDVHIRRIKNAFNDY